ncbi:MAG: hypothetical protein PHU71_00880 [Candidatus Gracilibacteria bacterium]|nr:hypothetical protein [Candidatus Gracilibacteria bacterium]
MALSVDQNQIDTAELEGVNEEPVKKSHSSLISGLALSLLIAVVIFYFYTWPRYQNFEQNILTIQAKENTIENNNARLNVLKADNENREPDEEEAALITAIPTDNDVPNLIRELDSLSRLAQGDILDDTYLKSFSIGIPSKKEGEKFFTTQITASFSSFAFSLPKLLEELESDSHRLYNVNSISISFDQRNDEISDLLDPDIDKEYELLLLKRANFLLEPEEEVRLAEIQYQISDNYQRLLYKGNRSASEEEKFNKLKEEVKRIQNERNYTVTIETYSI